MRGQPHNQRARATPFLLYASDRIQYPFPLSSRRLLLLPLKKNKGIKVCLLRISPIGPFDVRNDTI